MAPHSSTFAWKISWTEEPGRLQSMGSLELDTTERLHFHALEKEMATPLQCSCLENPRDGGAWWAAVYGVVQSQTRLKRLGDWRPKGSESHSVMSDSLQAMDYIVHGILQARILTGVGSLSLPQIIPTQGSNPGLLHCRRIFLTAEPQGKPKNTGVGSLSFSSGSSQPRS